MRPNVIDEKQHCVDKSLVLSHDSENPQTRTYIRKLSQLLSKTWNGDRKQPHHVTPRLHCMRYNSDVLVAQNLVQLRSRTRVEPNSTICAHAQTVRNEEDKVSNAIQ
ncbi:hypothetical protein T265_07194 [Opisthorchis viverrini]|uniref:Uncharacterized protein n=1 Tax=Opisthorchis viverrini TaxID=6198 RepID=A0A074ZHT2_OPIVI|nr:hypothetical protein T265_07194 [Opisthorchis viverrini]KER25317.1 hypothetical protein T265_07194 [Opisthorchis viverrini]